ncbi:MAG TPA: S-layer homology domain-containing protein [Bacillales bacterium]|nr:S-layer homology domain-containing protein [Bacillales bacterium]
MKKRVTSLVLSALLVASPLTSASANNDQALTRGEFFKLVVDHLGYDAANVKVELPKDIAADSPYANAAKVLKDKEIVVGFEDGTFKPNQTITPAEASSIVSRFLAIKGDATSALASTYGITFENTKILTLEKAEEIVSKALTSDKTALELLDKTTAAQNEQKSFKADATMSMEFKLKEGTPEIPGMTNGMKMDSDIVMNFNREKGLLQTITTKVPNPETNKEVEMVIDQYFVPEGTFMRMTDPTSGEDQWLDMSASMPLPFNELMNMNEDNMNMMNDLNRKYFFYRDLGKEQINGKSQYKLGFSGKINSLEEITGMMSNVLNDQSDALLSGLEGMPNMEMAMTGTMMVDEKTFLPTRQNIQFEIKFGAAKDPALEMPFESIHYVMDLNFSDFNNVNDIVLPEAAKNAEKFPSLEDNLEGFEQLPESTEKQ